MPRYVPFIATVRELPASGYPLLCLAALTVLSGCDRTAAPDTAASPPDEPALSYRSVRTAAAYVGDEACNACHSAAASAYEKNAMARSFRRWTSETRIEAALEAPIFHAATGFYYTVVEAADGLYQEEYLIGPDGRRLHELRRRIDYVMGSGNVARTYFTEENGRLFQLPLSWFSQHGWDFSPGYELNNARFGRLMPDRCIACHGSYPRPIPFLEGKYAELIPGIGCERCHGPGALHVAERSAGVEANPDYDDTIVNPSDLPFERRLDICQQCHVHTPVTLLRQGQDAFSYLPSQPLSDHSAFFKLPGDIDIVSHADRLRQSACFIATRPTERPLECATCHDPHSPPSDPSAHSQPCRTCHPAAALAQRMAASPSQADHSPNADCVACHMPEVRERTVPHGSFTDHWIRIVAADEAARPRRNRARPIEPYFESHQGDPDAGIYQRMGEIVYATRAADPDRLRDAAAALGRALRRDTVQGGAHFLLGLAYQQMGRNDDAIVALERSLRIDPEQPQRLHALAQLYERVGRDPAAIDSLYESALELQPALAWIRADYADFLAANGRNEEAEAAYRSALTERPSLDVAAFNLAALVTAEGRLEEATEIFREAVRLDPSHAEALAHFLLVRTTGNAIAEARPLGSPLGRLPVRDRGPNAVRLTTTTGAGGDWVAVLNVPADASVQVLKPNGALVRRLPAARGSARRWDLLNEAGIPIAGGLYRVRVDGSDASGRPAPPQLLSFAIVRVRSD